MIDLTALTKKYEVKYYEQNMKKELKESSLLNFLQDAATVSAEELGFGPSFVFSNNMAWFVLKYHIELYEPLKSLDSILLKTEPRGAQRLYAYRDFEICKSDGTKIGAASSLWALIDMAQKKMLPMQKALPQMIKYEKKEEDFEFEKIPQIEKVNFSKEFDVRFDDADVNKHANNANYIIWALETLPHEFRMKNHAKTIDIKYRKEICAGAKVLSQTQSIKESTDKNTTLHFLYDSENNEELCSLKIVWTNN